MSSERGGLIADIREVIKSGGIPVLDDENLELFLAQTEVMSPDAKGYACWVWTGKVIGKTADYGFFQGVHGMKGFVTQLAYTTFVGEIPLNPRTGKRMPLDHLCYTTRCWNPTHLQPKTQGENVKSSYDKGERKPRKVRIHCRMGHLYTEESTRYSKLGFRFCGICYPNARSYPVVVADVGVVQEEAT